ncbi:MAG: hypothetical protein EOO77_12775 [Oxalobacteraceae bacterium]|nr:MAG: hypothetical protein EOO77_12775 [Oxalobacteraceae bacterium]
MLDALEQALHQPPSCPGRRARAPPGQGSQYLPLRYTDRHPEARVQPSVGSVGDSYDNGVTETVNGLFKAKVIHRHGLWWSFETVECATLEWVDRFNNLCHLPLFGNVPPVEAEARCYV